jgi:flagellar biosynthesis protein FlhG
MVPEGQRMHPVRVYTVTSGKGGVGKTNIVLNLAIALTDAGQKVLIVDADLGLGNLDVLLGIQHTYTLGDVLAQRCTQKEALVQGPKGVKILPAESGMEELTRLTTGQKIQIFSIFNSLYEEADTILIDTASGISSNVLFFSSFADQILLVATPEPTSITDAYATMKVLSRTPGEQDFQILINRVESEQQAREVYQTLDRAAEHFLEIRPGYMGFISKDRNLPRAVSRQRPLLEFQPDSPACQDIRSLARRLVATALHVAEAGENLRRLHPQVCQHGVG